MSGSVSLHERNPDFFLEISGPKCFIEYSSANCARVINCQLENVLIFNIISYFYF